MAEYYQRCFGTELKETGVRTDVPPEAAGREWPSNETRRPKTSSAPPPATLRAIAERATSGHLSAPSLPGRAGKRVRLPLPARALPSGEAAPVRGAADALALRLRYHDDRGPCRAARPRGETARAIFEALEQARVEALGARRMAGVAANLAAMLEERYRRQGYDHIDRAQRRDARRGAPAAGARGADRRAAAARPRARWSTVAADTSKARSARDSCRIDRSTSPTRTPIASRAPADPRSRSRSRRGRGGATADENPRTTGDESEDGDSESRGRRGRRARARRARSKAASPDRTTGRRRRRGRRGGRGRD